MRDNRFKFGLASTAIWIGVVAFILFRDPIALGKMTPNDWGSFLSGAFAPLAFLWLVLGYLQQGEELKLSTHALQLQAEELKNSVEQQRALVEVSRMQVEAEREALKSEQREKLLLFRPNIIVESDGGSFRGDGHSTYQITFSNSGNAASNVRIELRLQLGRVQQLVKAAIFDRGSLRQAGVAVERPNLIDGATIVALYNDQLGNQFEDRYLVRRQDESPHASLRISAI